MTDKPAKHSEKKLHPEARLMDFAHIEISDIDPEIRKKITTHLKSAKENLIKLRRLFQQNQHL